MVIPRPTHSASIIRAGGSVDVVWHVTDIQQFMGITICDQHSPLGKCRTRVTGHNIVKTCLLCNFQRRTHREIIDKHEQDNTCG